MINSRQPRKAGGYYLRYQCANTNFGSQSGSLDKRLAEQGLAAICSSLDGEMGIAGLVDVVVDHDDCDQNAAILLITRYKRIFYVEIRQLAP